jgi:hypothetical protein
MGFPLLQLIDPRLPSFHTPAHSSIDQQHHISIVHKKEVTEKVYKRSYNLKHGEQRGGEAITTVWADLSSRSS